jgi:16S rRNA (adenine1518-N6/adenine1519-N6)-dimethyltransferase
MSGTRRNPPVLKRLGQHFLKDTQALQAIVDAVAPEPGDTIVEIGPGRGVLTDELARYDNGVIAVEIDHLLSEKLRERYAASGRVRIIESDILKTDIASIVKPPFVVVGNVPYYITTPILFHVLNRPLPKRIVLLVQLEVAERIIASPGSREYGALSINVQAAAAASIVRRIPPGAFSPPPKVDSAILRIVPRSDPLVDDNEADRFRTFVQGMFGMRRKQIANAIRSVASLDATKAAEVLERVGVDPRARPETLSPADFVLLMRESTARSG